MRTQKHISSVTHDTNHTTMKLQLAIITLYAALALKGFASASNLFYVDGADDANQSIVGGVEVKAHKHLGFLSDHVTNCIVSHRLLFLLNQYVTYFPLYSGN